MWDNCQVQKKKNQKNYMRTQTYIFLQKLRCPKCGRILAGGASHKIKSDKWYFYYRCEKCKNKIQENKIEKRLRIYYQILWNTIMLLMNSFYQY